MVWPLLVIVAARRRMTMPALYRLWQINQPQTRVNRWSAKSAGRMPGLELLISLVGDAGRQFDNKSGATDHPVGAVAIFGPDTPICGLDDLA